MITVIGLGFVGLTTALGFSEKGFKVFGYDIDKEKVEFIKNNQLPFYEKGLDKALAENLGKNFCIVENLKNAIENSEVVFLCVGTPSDEKGHADLKYIKSALKEILKYINKNEKKVVVTKSTIPPATTQNEIIPYINSLGFEVGKNIFVANNPEFLREGFAWEDFISPDRIVIGAEDNFTEKTLRKIYEVFNVPIHIVSLNTGEFIKYLSNTFLSTLISYSNEMSMIADSIGNIDIKSAFKIFHEDKRWFGNPAGMKSYAYPGCGFGGYCLPKDTQALVKRAEEFGYKSKILSEVLNVNSEIKPHWIEKIKSSINNDAKIAVLGLSFKPESDDIRQTPALEILNLLIKNGYKKIVAYDPLANELFDKKYYLPIEYADSMESAIKDVENVIILTGWKEFIEKKDLLKNKTVFDMRYVL